MIVAHFSDLHLLSLEGVRVRDFLGKRMTGAVNLLLNRGGEFPVTVAQRLIRDVNRQGAAHAILSGDLTNLSFPAELELARSLLEQLELPPTEITVVPGNHDVYVASAAKLDAFRRILAPYLKGDLQPGPATYPFARLRGELAVVALSSAIPSPPLLAVGMLGAAQLRLAEQLLSSPECRGRFRLVVIHHPPRDPHVRWHNRLTDAAGFLGALRRTGAELVVHGHLHRRTHQTAEGPRGGIPIIGVGSGTWLSPRDPGRRAQYNLYQIEGGALQRVRTRRYDPASGEFVEVGDDPE